MNLNLITHALELSALSQSDRSGLELKNEALRRAAALCRELAREDRYDYDSGFLGSERGTFAQFETLAALFSQIAALPLPLLPAAEVAEVLDPFIDYFGVLSEADWEKLSDLHLKAVERRNG